MNILITGANGFIGKALTKAMLKNGHTIFALVTKADDMKDISMEKLHVIELFFDDYNKISTLVNCKIDIAYHFAWSGLCGDSAKDVKIQLANVLATSILIEQLHQIGVKKIVLASTMNTLEARDMLADPLHHNPRGISIHVASKINAEIVARTLCQQYSIMYNEGLIAMAYGEQNYSKMIPNIAISSLIDKKPLKLISGNNLYDMVYITDIVTAFIAIGLKGINKQTYYIGHEDLKTFKDIFVRIGFLVSPNTKLVFGAFPEDNLLNFNLVDRSLLTKDTGWIPTANFDDSILSTAAWIKKEELHF